MSQPGVGGEPRLWGSESLYFLESIAALLSCGPRASTQPLCTAVSAPVKWG